jgi:hypothetical protein
MANEIRSRFKWTVDEYLTAYKYARQQRIRPAFQWCLLGVFWCLLLILVYALVMRPVSALIVFLGICVLCFAAIQWVLQPWSLRRRFNKRPDRDSVVENCFSAEGFHTKLVGAESNVTWESIAKCVNTPEGFLIYVVDEVFTWVPHSAFENEAEIEATQALIREHVTRCYGFNQPRNQ